MATLAPAPPTRTPDSLLGGLDAFSVVLEAWKTGGRHLTTAHKQAISDALKGRGTHKTKSAAPAHIPPSVGSLRKQFPVGSKFTHKGVEHEVIGHTTGYLATKGGPKKWVKTSDLEGPVVPAGPVAKKPVAPAPTSHHVTKVAAPAKAEKAGGSGEAGSVAEAFAGMDPKSPASSPKNKKWLASVAKQYGESEYFRSVADSLSYFTQGSFGVLQQASHLGLTGQAPHPDAIDPGKTTVVRLRNPLSSYKSFIPGQNLEAPKSSTSLAEAARRVNHVIAASPPTTAPIYRGMQWRRFGDQKEPPPLPKAGETFNMTFPSSFTHERSIAEDFSKGTAKGQTGSKDPPDYAITYEVRPGARGVNVSAISPWKQQEIVSNGKFRVVEAHEEHTGTVYGKYGSKRETYARHVVLEQTGTWGPEE